MAFSWFPGSCTTTYTHSDDPLILPTKTGPKRALPEICKDVIPPCNLNPFLFNGHLQTFWTALKYDGPPVHYKRRVFAAENDNVRGHFTVDYVVAPPPKKGTAKDGGPEDAGLREDPVGIGHSELPPRTTYFTDEEFESIGSDDTKPLLITLHGLSGGSYETYLRHVLEPLVKSTPEGQKAGLSGGDWEALVINSRGCAGSKITSSILYNARATWDVRQIVKWCKQKWPRRPLFGVGYSLGANILTNYVGEEGAGCLLNAAVVVSNPWNLDVSSVILQSTWLGMEVYSKTMGRNMLAMFEAHKEQIVKNTNINAAGMYKLKYLHEFDRAVQCATWGYKTEGAYYRDASCVDTVFNIKIPFLAINAKDDPIAFNQSVPYEEVKQNPYVVLCVTSGGGHLGWFQLGGQRWHPGAIEGFLNAMARDIDYSKVDPPTETPDRPHGGLESPFTYVAMRRKAYIPSQEQ